MRHYDHRVHAGNAGDVWKHFLLLEAADCLLTPDSSLVYAESHVGRPEYFLKAACDWEGGIGKIWPVLPSLLNFCYFYILNELNPRGLMRYPGSARLVWELARRKKALLDFEVWDIDAEVVLAWLDYLNRPEIPFFSIHLGDGFSGVMSLLNEAIPGLLLIDPPFLDPEDVNAAEELFDRARELGWTVLCWHMVGTIDTMDTNGREFLPESRFHESFHEFPIRFSQIGLDYCGAKGCSVAVNSPHEFLEHRLEGRIEEFRKIIQKYEY
jgi:23S rRNA (adenine2030-N6)-methyltransferase